MKVMPLQQRRLSDDIVERIETMILEGNLRPGERLPAERALAEEFGVSRPSLREAIQKLVARGLLTSRHGGGTFVSDALGSAFRDPMIELLGRNPEAQRDLMEFRHTLEGSCAYYAALRATEPDRERLKIAFERVQDSYLRQGRISRTEEGHNDALFHLAIAEASHNAVLLHTIRSLFDLVERNVVTNIGGMYTQGGGGPGDAALPARGALQGDHRSPRGRRSPRGGRAPGLRAARARAGKGRGAAHRTRGAAASSSLSALRGRWGSGAC